MVVAERALEDRVLAAWAEHDEERALHQADRDVIRSTESARSLVLSLFSQNLFSQSLISEKLSSSVGDARDLFSACARLGGLMAEAGASPSLAAGVIDSAVRAMSEANAPALYDASRIASARASLVEGYVAAVRDAERIAGLLAWEYPSCVVFLESGTAAVACGYPSDDDEAVGGWAGRVASRLSKDKVRRVILSGPEPAKAEIMAAVELVGIEVVSPAPGEKSRSWLRLPWRK